MIVKLVCLIFNYLWSVEIMKVHLFQRYHTKENVATANALLLLSRMYASSAAEFYTFLSNYILPNGTEAETSFELQKKTKTKRSVLDACISQPSFKIAIETKLNNNFDMQQLQKHLDVFSSESYKILLTLDPEDLNSNVKNDIESILKEYSDKNDNEIVVHKHLTFQDLVVKVGDCLGNDNNEMKQILEDYYSCCFQSNLISNADKMMRVRLAGDTFDSNKRLNLYYDPSSKGFSGHEYLGLYKDKAVRLIGKIQAIIDAEVIDSDEIEYIERKGKLTDDIKNRIKEAIEDSTQYGYNLDKVQHCFFVVEKFYDTFFEKTSTGALMGAKFFDLSDVLNTKVLPNDVSRIAEELRKKTWS